MPSGHPVPHPPKSELRALLRRGFAREQLARKYGVKWDTVRRWFTSLRLDYPKQCPKACCLTTDQIERLYFRNRLPTSDIAKLTGLTPNGVRHRLRVSNGFLRKPHELTQREQNSPFLSAGLIPLEPYGNNLTARLCRCKGCGREVSPTRANLSKGQGGCAYCAGRKLHPDDYDRAFLEANLTPLEPYVSASDARRCRCNLCRNVVTPRHSDLQRGQGGCKYCADNQPKDPGKRMLQTLYWKEKKTTYEIAEILGMSGSTVVKYLEKHGIQRRGGYEKYGCERPTTEQLEQWYVIDEMTASEIGQRCNASTRTVIKWLREAGTRVRRSGSSHGVYRSKLLLANPRLYWAPAFVYIVRYTTDDEDYVKVGVGRQNSRRLENHFSTGAILVQLREGILYDCYVIEQQIRRDFRRYSYDPRNDRMLSGRTECFLSDAPIQLNDYELYEVG